MQAEFGLKKNTLQLLIGVQKLPAGLKQLTFDEALKQVLIAEAQACPTCGAAVTAADFNLTMVSIFGVDRFERVH